MTRVHPQFLMNGFKKAVEKQDFGEFNKELTNGMNYWTNLFNTEVGALDPDEAPPLALTVVLVAMPAAVILGVVLALIQRIREIGKGEIEDAKHY